MCVQSTGDAAASNPDFFPFYSCDGRLIRFFNFICIFVKH
jgi:hypothetical protein